MEPETRSKTRSQTRRIDTIIDLDRHEILSILRDVQKLSIPAEYAVDPSTDPYTDRRLA